MGKLLFIISVCIAFNYLTEGNLVPLTSFRGKSLWTDSNPHYTWFQADQFCRRKEKNLATLSEEDQILLQLSPPGASYVFWVGTFSGGGEVNPPNECPSYDFRTGTINKADCSNKSGIMCLSYTAFFGKSSVTEPSNSSPTPDKPENDRPCAITE